MERRDSPEKLTCFKFNNAEDQKFDEGVKIFSISNSRTVGKLMITPLMNWRRDILAYSTQASLSSSSSRFSLLQTLSGITSGDAFPPNPSVYSDTLERHF